ncbi:hypothetical protein IMSAGC007_01754 [Lachnospiraceae bacterium]|nr:hypothetical protein IMSAGC007_01754 [Lachnospiraceae bacterium]
MSFKINDEKPRKVSYACDKAGQLVELTAPAGVTTCYEYDLLEYTSRIYSREGVTTYCYSEKNQLVREEGLNYIQKAGEYPKKESQTGESRFFYNNKNQ